MRNQRTLFLGRRPVVTPKKDGTNPPVPERRFAAADPNEIDIRFSNRTATQFGGYPLWASFLDWVGLEAGIASHIKMARGPRAFTAPELSRFLIDAKILGADRLMHLERFRLDPILTTTTGIDGLPSGKTMGVYLKEYQDHHIDALGRYNTRTLGTLWKKTHRGKPKPGVVLDYDSSTTTAYGRQEGADRGRSFRKKDKPGFQPRYGFIGGVGLMVHHELLPQSHNLGKDFIRFHEETVLRVPKKAKIWAVRGDGALYSHEHIRYFEKRKLVYAISAQKTPHLQEAIAQIPPDAWEDGEDEEGRPYSIARLRYCPKTWGEVEKKERTFIISRRLRYNAHERLLFGEDVYKYFAYITNYNAPLETQFRFCTERCSLESFIKEGKGNFQSNFLPCKELSANQAYLGHVQLAYNLAIFFKMLGVPNGVNRWTIQTLRDRIFSICGNLRRRKGRWVLSLPAWWPYQTVFRRIQRRCPWVLQT
jgi:hypothetical protein